MAKANKSALDQLLDEITPLEQEKTDAKMLIAVRIAEAMEAKQWKNKDLLAAVGKDNPSIITKWLSGTHDFTIETIVEIERVLDVSLLNTKEKRSE
jgi:ribosome-binding protein aMBF1 (putative translation factor)